jgi:hypothetical protein
VNSLLAPPAELGQRAFGIRPVCRNMNESALFHRSNRLDPDGHRQLNDSGQWNREKRMYITTV